MKPIVRHAPSWLKDYTVNTFPDSARHLLITGSRGIGKSTLRSALLEGTELPGIESRVVRGEDGLPRMIRLAVTGACQQIIIGRRSTGRMEPDAGGLALAAEWVSRLCRLPGDWVYVDEIGFLEEASPAYQQALWSLFAHKRVLAVLRKEDLPFLRRISAREDVYLLDLDRQEVWE